MAGQPITAAILLERTGRENGPDIMLKLDDAIKTLIGGGVITQTSNITEVLNVIAYLCNTTRTDGSIEGNSSIDITQSGLHNAATGLYTTPNTGNGPSADSLWLIDAGGAATTQMIDLNALQAVDCAQNHIPVGILTRTGVAGAGGLRDTNDGANTGLTATVAGNIAGEALTNFVDCIKQLINIAESTRTIFGPKGWTALFQQVKGGGSTGKTHAKRTHRQHRRRYSSKQY